MIGLDVDFSSLKIGTISLIKRIKGASESGMKEAVVSLMGDCLDEIPMCPRESGALAASHSVFVNGTLIATSAHRPVTEKGIPTPLMLMPNLFIEELSGTLVVHKVYASSIHEGISRWGTPYKYKLPGTGRKWVESKMLRFWTKYRNMIASKVMKAL